MPGVLDVSHPRPAAARLTLVDVVSDADALSNASQQALRDMRALAPPFSVLSRGQTASLVDLKQSLAHHLPGGLAILMARERHPGTIDWRPPPRRRGPGGRVRRRTCCRDVDHALETACARVRPMPLVATAGRL